MQYNHLFSKGKIGTLELKNRIVMPAIGVGLANADTTMSDEMIAFYEERAKGGTGLIITEVTRVNDEHGAAQPRQISVARDELIPGLTGLTDAIHKHGAKIFVQLYHPGNQGISAFMKDNITVSPSGIMSTLTQQPTRALGEQEVESLVQDFINGAVRAKKAGFDGVEIHGAHGYMINQFFSPYTNKRTDKYGGSTEKRAQFAKEVILGIREKLGQDFPVILRISVDEFLHLTPIQEPGLMLEEGVQIAKYLAPFGLDAINVSSGIYESMSIAWEPSSYDQGWRVYLAEAVKKVVSVPVFTVGVIREPAFAEKILANGSADFICIARGNLADPEWANKAKDGRESELRKCISCLHCMESLIQNGEIDEPLECAINARCAREFKYNYLKKDGADRKVAVIGGGPAGLEAARVLAERGFKTVLFEKSGQLGGQLLLANKPPKKDKINWLIGFFENELKRLKVEIKLNSSPTVADIKALSPYAVFVGTGSDAIVPTSIEGVRNSNVYTTTDILSGKVKLSGKNVAVIGSGMTGLETAELLACGNTVTVVEMLEKIGGEAYWQNMVDVLMRLGQQKVKMLPGHKLAKIEKDKIILEIVKDKTMTELSADAVVLGLGVKAGNKVAEEMKASFSNVQFIGDTSKIGRIANAVKTAFVAAYNL
jgi:2,4-dienoyl-CoA reductase-like NADH-dependent reductase (Old Yellow Enzyme family)/thioredoxin reductase